MDVEKSLHWTPTFECLHAAVESGDSLRMIIAPFIQRSALESVLGLCPRPGRLTVVTRWTGRDIATGVSDISIYPILRDAGSPLYINASLHLKLIVFGSNRAFVTSSNITGKGLGISNQPNEEVGCIVDLSVSDWNAINTFLANCDEVTDEVYEAAAQYAMSVEPIHIDTPVLELPSPALHDYSILDAPAVSDPETFWSRYSGEGSTGPARDLELAHDMALFDLPPGMSREDLLKFLSAAFRRNRLTIGLISELRTVGSMSFGSVTQWIHDRCADHPAPYRKDIKATASRLYAWLDHCVEEIRLTRPGHSQILNWMGSE